jgi:LPS-assembly lipoprotein
LVQELRRNIRGGGEVTLVSTPEEADATLNITSESRSRQILSLNSQGRVREYVLNYRATISVRDNKNVELLAPTQLALKRDISYNEEFVLAKEAEEALLYRDMQSDLVQQILRRLSAIKPVAKERVTLRLHLPHQPNVPDAGGAMPAPAGGAANK